MANFKPREQDPTYQMHARMGGSQSRIGHSGQEENLLATTGMKLLFPRRPTGILYQLRHPGYWIKKIKINRKITLDHEQENWAVNILVRHFLLCGDVRARKVRMQVTLHAYSQQHDNISFGAQEKTGTWCHIGRVDKAPGLVRSTGDPRISRSQGQTGDMMTGPKVCIYSLRQGMATLLFYYGL